MKWYPMLAAFALLPLAVRCGDGHEDRSALIARLGDDDPRVREDATRKLVADPAAAPWVRAAGARSADPEVSGRARTILAAYAKQRRAAAPEAVAALTKSGHADLFLEWYLLWHP